MRASTPLLIKSLISKIHPQLPLNARESDQLLNILKTSFRKHLDVVHPTEERKAGNATTSTSSLNAYSSHVSTTRHLDNILSDPLFAIKPKSSTFNNGSINTGRRAMVEGRQTLGELINHFKECLAMGTVTQVSAAKFLTEIFRTALLLSPKDIKRNIAAIGSGWLVLRWAQSAGLSHAPEVIQDSLFTSNLTAHLVLEDRHSELKEWILPSSKLPEEMERKWKRNVIMNYINTCIAQKDRPDIIVERFCDLNTAFAGYKMNLFSAAGYRLGLHLTSPAATTVSASAYQRYCKTYLPNAASANILQALLPLHAPDAADASIAVKHLRNYASRTWQFPEPGPYHTMAKVRKRVLMMCLDSANILIDKKQYKDASWVISYARKEFATELGMNDTDLAAHQGQTSELPSRVLQRRNMAMSGTLIFG